MDDRWTGYHCITRTLSHCGWSSWGTRACFFDGAVVIGSVHQSMSAAGSQAKKNSDGCYGLMYFDIVLRYLLLRHAITEEVHP